MAKKTEVRIYRLADDEFIVKRPSQKAVRLRVVKEEKTHQYVTPGKILNYPTKCSNYLN